MRIREAEAWVRELATRLGERGVRVEQVILFGSLARGDYLEDSDIDLIIVSPDWHGVEYTRAASASSYTSSGTSRWTPISYPSHRRNWKRRRRPPPLYAALKSTGK